MITVVVKCRKHPSVELADFAWTPEDEECTVRVDPCERCIGEAEQDGKDSRDEEIEGLRSDIIGLELQVEDLQEALGEKL